jgi:DNA-binding transcriptional LysR family regulator
LAELEARLGTRLLQRTTRRLSLTSEGEIFHERCRQILDGVAEAEAELTDKTGEATGLLKVSAPVTFGMLHLGPLWPAFIARHPKLLLDVTLSDRVVDLVEEGYDLAVRIARLKTSSLISRQIASTRLVLCASPRYLRKAGVPRHPSDLARHAVISYTLTAMGEQWDFDGPEGRSSVKVTPRMRTNNGDTCCAAALAHEGLVLQPTFLVGQYLASGALVEVLPHHRAAELGVHVVYPTRKHLKPKVRALVDFLAKAFRTPRWPA